VRLDELKDDGGGEAVYGRYAQELIRFATGLVGPSDAADVVSEALVGCIGASTWVGVLDRRAYLYKAVVNQSRQWTRSRSRRERREHLYTRESVKPGEAERRPEVFEAVRGLSVRQKAVIFLAYWEDLTPPQIAIRLGLSDGSVRRHLARGRTHLRKVLADD
jgi:RNA polymerase sigma factor (sigma-70 family)